MMQNNQVTQCLFSPRTRKVFKILFLIHTILNMVALSGFLLVHNSGYDYTPVLREAEYIGLSMDPFHYRKRENIILNGSNVIIINNSDSPQMEEECDLIVNSCVDDFECNDNERKPIIAVFLLALLVGYLGVGRCYTGYVCCGIIKGLTLGGCTVWYLIDWILVLALAWNTDAEGRCFRNWGQ